jgi:hypothetical protein
LPCVVSLSLAHSSVVVAANRRRNAVGEPTVEQYGVSTELDDAALALA